MHFFFFCFRRLVESRVGWWANILGSDIFVAALFFLGSAQTLGKLWEHFILLVACQQCGVLFLFILVLWKKSKWLGGRVCMCRLQ